MATSGSTCTAPTLYKHACRWRAPFGGGHAGMLVCSGSITAALQLCVYGGLTLASDMLRCDVVPADHQLARYSVSRVRMILLARGMNKLSNICYFSEVVRNSLCRPTDWALYDMDRLGDINRRSVITIVTTISISRTSNQGLSRYGVYTTLLAHCHRPAAIRHWP